MEHKIGDLLLYHPDQKYLGIIKDIYFETDLPTFYSVQWMFPNTSRTSYLHDDQEIIQYKQILQKYVEVREDNRTFQAGGI